GSNLSVPLGITNGAFGSVAGFDLATDKWGLTTPKGVVMRLNPFSKFKFSELEEGCFQINPTSSVFNFRSEDDSTTKVSRRQLPIQPRFAMTIHSAQGVTAPEGVIVDLTHGGFETYVAASRATRRENIFVLEKVNLKHLNNPPLPSHLAKELKRLQKLAEATEQRHGVNGEHGQPNNHDAADGPPSKRPRLDTV
ncbi:hypothetical protein CF319_g9633, partial [Tilletia indica]